MSEIILGVAGGIAAYKSAELLRLFTEDGHSVRVVPTDSSLQFVGAATWEALSGKPVQTGVFEHVDEVAHVRFGQSAELVVVAPATANLLAKAAHGLADDLLTTTLLTARCPIVFVPAMHTEMWENAATQHNVSVLRERGHLVVEPAVGRLTGRDSGKGRLPDPQQIFGLSLQALSPGHDLATGDDRAPGHDRDLAGRHVVVSAGGTREYLDPVRFLGNRSSGRQGFALAEAAVSRGARVTVVAAHVSIDAPTGADVVVVDTTEDLRQAVHAAAATADAVVMAAAPADFRPQSRADCKIKKSSDGAAPRVELVQNPDILAELVSGRASKAPIIVGFAAETGDSTAGVIEHGQAKLERKGCDLLVVNDVSNGQAFEKPDNEAVILGADGSVTRVPYGPKLALAHTVWDAVAQRLD